MKRLILSIALGVLLSSSLWALPSLQLDITGGTYVGGTDETTYSDGPTFELLALGLNPSGTYFLSAAIVPKTPLTTDFGSFTINGITYDSSNMQFGVPPVDATANPHLGDHGIYNTSFAEISFNFAGTPTVPSYNTQTGLPGQAGELLNLKTFAVNATGLGDGFAVHFDLYNKAFRRGDVIRGEFAPFSHDAQSRNGVPDGGTTMMLLGSALACLGALRRRFA